MGWNIKKVYESMTSDCKDIIYKNLFPHKDINTYINGVV